MILPAVTTGDRIVKELNMHVGIIGVGLMGHGIARNVLSKGGFDLSFLDHPGNQPVDELGRGEWTAHRAKGGHCGC